MYPGISKEAPSDIMRGIVVTSLLFVVSVFLPILGFLVSFFIPLPVLYFRAKLGRNPGAMVALGTLAVIVVFLGKISFDAFFFFQLLLLGFVLGELFEKELSLEKTVLYAGASLWITCAAALFFVSVTTGDQIMGMVSNFVGQNLELTLTLYEKMGVSQEHIQLIESSLDHIQYVLVRVIPGILISATLFASWCNLLLARPILSAREIPFPDFGSLKRWKAPEPLVWVAIGCGVLLLFPGKGVKVVGLNGLLIMMTVYFFQGIAIVSYFFEKKNFPMLLRGALYGFIALQQIFLLLVVALGFFDMWVDFRRLEKPADDIDE